MSYRILSAEFVCAASRIQDLPGSSLPEAAFVGRSNVGKSSLLNAICGMKSLARTSKTPGRTQQINFFRVRVAKGKKEDGILEAHFVDLPGYGYAKVNKASKERWGGLMEYYLAQRYTLALVVLLVDARREVEDEEKWFCSMGKEGSLIAAVTKVDKLSRNDLNRRKEAVSRALELSPQQVFLTSAGRSKEGIAELSDAVCSKLFMQNVQV